MDLCFFFFFQAEDGIRDSSVTGVQTCALPICIIAERELPVLSWVNHLQGISFDQMSIPDWTLEAGSDDSPGRPNSYKNPFAQLRLEVPTAPATDPERGPASARHKPWSET